MSCCDCKHFCYERMPGYGIKKETGICENKESANFSDIRADKSAWKILKTTDGCDKYESLNKLRAPHEI